MKTTAVLILSYTNTPHYFRMLRLCINSIMSDQVDVYVIETNSELDGKIQQTALGKTVEFIFPREEFNYNRFLNFGFNHIGDKYENVIISNNDVLYEEDCIDLLIDWLERYDSASPTELSEIDEKNDSIEGYEVGKHVRGWCIAMRYDVYKKMGMWDEAFGFWYQDNDYCEFLKQNDLSHALVYLAKATHLGMQSHCMARDIDAMTHKQLPKFIDKWGE